MIAGNRNAVAIQMLNTHVEHGVPLTSASRIKRHEVITVTGRPFPPCGSGMNSAPKSHEGFLPQPFFFISRKQEPPILFCQLLSSSAWKIDLTSRGYNNFNKQIPTHRELIIIRRKKIREFQLKLHSDSIRLREFFFIPPLS